METHVKGGTTQRRGTGVLVSSLTFILVFAGAAISSEADTIRQYQLEADGNELRLVMKEVTQPVPGESEVLVRVRAAALNRRDLSILESQYGGGRSRNGLVPLSDGAGEVIALGPGVTRFQLGDRVAGTFFARWVDGRRSAASNASARGGAIDGMLSEMVVSHQDGLVLVPEHLTFEEAATLPCAAVTAWNALFTHGRLQPDDFVLLEGTGGVSIFGLQFSGAAGARPIITSSSDAKLERARELGAFGTANYSTNPDWQDEVRSLTGNAGVAHVLEVGGQETLPKAVQALGFGGHIALIGGLSGSANSPADSLLHRPRRLRDRYLRGLAGRLRGHERFHKRTSAQTDHRPCLQLRGSVCSLTNTWPARAIWGKS